MFNPFHRLALCAWFPAPSSFHHTETGRQGTHRQAGNRQAGRVDGNRGHPKNGCPLMKGMHEDGSDFCCHRTLCLVSSPFPSHIASTDLSTFAFTSALRIVMAAAVDHSAIKQLIGTATPAQVKEFEDRVKLFTGTKPTVEESLKHPITTNHYNANAAQQWGSMIGGLMPQTFFEGPDNFTARQQKAVLMAEKVTKPADWNWTCARIEQIQKAMGDVFEYEELPEWLRPNKMPNSEYVCAGISVKRIEGEPDQYLVLKMLRKDGSQGIFSKRQLRDVQDSARKRPRERTTKQ